MTSRQKDLEKALNDAAQDYFKSQEKLGFNVFYALKVTEKENAHSAFIAYLLDSKYHGQYVFYKEFIKKLQNSIAPTTPNEPFGKLDKLKMPKISPEKNTKKTENIGRMDIELEFEDDIFIIIENKINANDQKSQIRKYIEDKENADKTLIIYLHPDKDAQPDEISFEKNDKFWKISKENNYNVIVDENGKRKAYYHKLDYGWIKAWLETCLKTLKQKQKTEFIIIIKQYIKILLNFIIPNSVVNKNIAKILLEKDDKLTFAKECLKNENHPLCKVIENAKSEVCNEIIERFYKALLDKFASKNVKMTNDKNRIWLCERGQNDYGEAEKRVYYFQMKFYPTLKNKIYPKFCLYYEGSNYKKVGISLCFDYENAPKIKHRKIQSKLDKIFNRTNGQFNIKKDGHQYLSNFVFNENEIENFAFWLVEKGDINAQVEIFIKKLDNYLKNPIIKETFEKLCNLTID